MSNERESDKGRVYMPTKYPGVIFRAVQGRAGGKSQDSIFYIKYRTPDRKQHFEPVGRSSEGMTAAKANMIRAARMEGRELGNVAAREKAKRDKRLGVDRLTFRGLWSIYDSENERRTRKNDISLLRYLESILDKNPAEFTTRTMTRLKLDLLARKRERPRAGAADTLSPQTVAHALGLVRRVLYYAKRQGLYRWPEALSFEMPEFDNTVTEHMEAAQLAAYWHALDADPDRVGVAYLKIILLTGIRKSAALALRWDDIDLEHGVMLLRAETAKKERVSRVPLNSQVVEVIRSLPRGDSEYLFPGENGGHRESFRHTAERVKKAAGLPVDFRPIHGLRHEFATRIASTGKVDALRLQSLLTHESPAMTQRYVAYFDEALRETAELGTVGVPYKKSD